MLDMKWFFIGLTLTIWIGPFCPLLGITAFIWGLYFAIRGAEK